MSFDQFWPSAALVPLRKRGNVISTTCKHYFLFLGQRNLSVKFCLLALLNRKTTFNNKYLQEKTVPL